MAETCFVDQAIQLSEEPKEILNARGLEIITVNPRECQADLYRIHYLLLHSFLDDSLLSGMVNCQYIGIRAHNTDYINKKIAASMGITVCGLQNQYGINAVAEHTMALIFALAKQLFPAHDNVKSGRWRQGMGLNVELAGKKLGILGYGKIGKRVAEIGKLLGMEVMIAAKQQPQKDQELHLHEVLKDADIITVLIPATEANRNFLNQERIEQLKPGAIVINTARGSVVDYQALENGLRSGRLAGVGLDVYPEEPVKDHPICHYPNVICTPHIAYATKEALEKMNQELILNLMSYVDKETT